MPTRTTNRLHFSDLAPLRFEDLCLNLIYSLRSWIDIRHYGPLGSDGGIDIFAIEQIENGAIRNWYVQCRRYSKATASTLKDAVDDALQKAQNRPNVLLVVVACDVNRKNQENYYKYARQNGVELSLLWTQSILEAKLYSERKDLLFAYFGVSLTANTRSQEAIVHHNIALKKRMRKDFTKEEFDPKVTLWKPYHRFRANKIVLHSIDDQNYPKVKEDVIGISDWFVVEPYDFYHNGLEVVIGGVRGIIDQEGQWAVIKDGDQIDKTRYVEITMFYNGRIPYHNIIEYDINGDEYYNCPHIYCNFSNNGTPYEDYRFVEVDNNYTLYPEKRFLYKDGV